MKRATFLLFMSIYLPTTWAELKGDEIWRCGKEYKNDLTVEQAKNCKLVSGGSLVVEPQKPLTDKQRDQYRNCRFDAAKAPTETGVRVALMLCNEKFNQYQ